MINTKRQIWPMPKKPKPIVFIGSGGIVRSAHIPAYLEQGYQLAGTYDVNPATAHVLAKKFKITKVFESLAEVAKEKGVVFDIAVPADQIINVLKYLPNRSIVLIQKPMGRDLREASRILKLCKEKKLIAAVNFQLRFAPNMLALQHKLANQKLGNIVDVEVRTRTNTPWSAWKFLRGIPRLEILYHSIHYIDLLRACFGEPQKIWASADGDAIFKGYADTRTMVYLLFKGGIRASIITAHSHDFDAMAKSSHVLVEGTKAAMIAKMGVNLNYPYGEPDTLEICQRSGTWKPIALKGSWFPQAFSGTMSNLQRFASGEDPILHTAVSDAWKTMAVVEACYASSAKNKKFK